MRITYSIADQDWLAAKSIGIYNISLGLGRALAQHPALERLTCLVNSTLPADMLSSARTETRIVDVPLRGRWGRIAWDQAGCYRAARRSGNPWLFLPKGFGSFVQRCPVKLAVYLHDIIILIYPERYPGVVSRAHYRYFDLTCRQTLRHADLVFTNTEFSRREILRWARERKIRCPPVVVAGYGFEPRLSPRPRRDQILVMVRDVPHKRTDLAVAWTERWRTESGYEGRILCAGPLPEGLALPRDPAWVSAGKVPPKQMIELMAESRAVVHFTEYEGFGMPPVEAVLAGTPPVYSQIPVAQEVMGETGCPFSNDDYDSFSHAMNRALGASPDEIQKWADLLEQRHNWPQVANRVMDALRSFPAN
ncbi:MAG TPA: glycosyltransferase [Kiritimatiellia bacterium]|nr:glycosyltransferase [Kiritimatiellia bacterium]